LAKAAVAIRTVAMFSKSMAHICLLSKVLLSLPQPDDPEHSASRGASACITHLLRGGFAGIFSVIAPIDSLVDCYSD
jgi:hypothetical protein